MNNISFQYPTWYIFLCVALGIVFALALYFRDRRFRDQSKQLNWGLGILRGVLVTFLSALLLSPLLKSLLTETQKPVVVIAQDVSESVASEMSAEELATYQQNLQQLSTDLAEEYDLVEYSFGEEVREGIDTVFQDKQSNLSEVLTTIYDLYGGQNLGAVVLASDGIYNEGSNPIYTGTKLNAPIYTIALGDTIPKRDLVVKRAFHNKIAYLNDRFAVQIDVAAQNCTGQNTNLVVSKIVNGNSTTLQTIPISINQDNFFTTREIIIEADQAGVQRYRIALSTVSGEASRSNNVKDFFVEVLDARQKILILANAPHPDLTAIKQTLEVNKNYDLTTAYITDLQENIREFDFVVLHQLPSKSNAATNVLNTLKNENISHLFVVGAQSNLPAFNKAQPLLSIRGDGRNTDFVQGIVQNDFNLFTLNEELKQAVRQFPPLIAPFGEYRANPNASILLRQQIGRVDTERPLFLLGEVAGAKVGVLAAEGLWKWRLFDYLQNNNHDLFNELIGKTVQYISLKEDKRRFRVNLDKNIFDENETVVFGAELYNQSYELVNDADVKMVITSNDGKNYDYVFNKTDRAYSLNAGILPVGNYSFNASTTFNGQQLTYQGQFSVQPIQLELYETTANYNILRILSEDYGGELLFADQVGDLATRIQSKGNVKPVIYQTAQTRSVINLKWIFFLLLGLLTLEWFLRRYFGAY
ncbi:MAG: hypothetical protein AAGG68_13655 [Bacteroidota bacterium]